MRRPATLRAPKLVRSPRRRQGGRWAALMAWGIVLLASSSLPSSAGAPPNPSFGISLSASPTRGVLPLSVVFNATALSGSPTWYSWDFGDGLYYNNTPASAETVEHTYLEAGSFTATVTISESSVESSSSIGITVVLAALRASITATPDSGTAPLSVVLQAQDAGGTETYTSFNWTFGNGQSGRGNPVPVTYTSGGDFHVELVTRDSSGASAAAFLWVNVTSPKSVTPPPTTTGGFTTLTLVLVAVAGFVLGTLLAVALLRRRDRRSPPPKSPEGVAEAEVPARLPSPPEPPELLGSPSGGPEDRTGVALPSAPPERPPSPTPASAPVPAPAAAPTGAVVPPRKSRSERERPAPRREGAPAPEALRISERVVLHLAAQGALGTEEVAPVAFSQAGMAEALGIRQNALTNVLRRLEAASVLVVDTRHVEGRPRRMKVYRLTGRGESLAHDLRRRGAPGARRGEGRSRTGPDPAFPDERPGSSSE